jgi:hypothetical protein
MTGTAEIAIREGVVVTPAERVAAAAEAGMDSWLIVAKDVFYLAERLCNTPFVPKNYRGEPEAAAAAILTGRELGLPPMTSLRHVQVVEGVPSLDAEYKRARVLAAGHEFDILGWDGKHCEVSGRRKGSHKPPLVVEYTIEDARLAGLVRDRSKYVTAPRVMLLARATTLLCNAIFADVTNGLATTELLEADDEDASPAALPPAPERQRVTTAQLHRTVTAEVVTQDAASGDAPPIPAPEAASTPAGGERPPSLAASGQVSLIQKQFRRIGTDPDTEQGWADMLTACARLVRLAAIASLQELTQDEARGIIDTLKTLPDGDAGAKALGALLSDGEVHGGQ